jgi:hypothetical protein
MTIGISHRMNAFAKPVYPSTFGTVPSFHYLTLRLEHLRITTALANRPIEASEVVNQ